MCAFILLGNGDILSFEDYYSHLESSTVSGIMIARSVLAIPNAMFCRIRLHICFVAMCVMKGTFACVSGRVHV